VAVRDLEEGVGRHGRSEKPGDEYHVITGARHCANLDRPDQVNALVGTFLERHLTD
jgi:pimeloyl-ACP methyl ester carboxylesterase